MIVLNKVGNIAELVLNRPEKHNAITPAMFKQLHDAGNEINEDSEIHAVLFYGAGDRAFCAGTDINTLKEYANFWEWRNRIDYVNQIRKIKKPVVCVIKGWALGGGHELAVASDIRVAAESAVFGSPEIGLGWLGAGGTSQYLPKLVGYGQAMKILLTGERIDAQKALSIGLVEEVVATGEEMERGRELTKLIASFSPVATQATKAAVRAGMEGNTQLGLQLENELMTLCFAMGEDKKGEAKFNSRK